MSNSFKKFTDDQRNQRLISYLTDYIYTVKLDKGEVIDTYHGPGCYSVTGYKSEDYADDPDLWINMVHDDDKEIVREQFKIARKGEDVDPIEHRIIHSDGSIRWVKNSIVLQKDENENLISYDGIINDITELKKAEDLNRIKNEQLKHADKMVSLGILVSGIAHEINNPNNFILLNINHLIKVWEETKPILSNYYQNNGDFSLGGMPYSKNVEKIDQSFNSILIGSERIKKIINNLTNYAKDDSGKLNHQLNINDVVEIALAITNNFIKKSTGNLDVQLAENLPSINGNPQQLEQVVINLINNACQSLTNIRQKIGVYTFQDYENNSVVIEIDDEGEGIEEEDLKHIFDPFFTTKRDKGGTGLGLSISYNIVKSHKGEFRIESQRKKGTNVKIHLPLTGKIN